MPPGEGSASSRSTVGLSRRSSPCRHAEAHAVVVVVVVAVVVVAADVSVAGGTTSLTALAVTIVVATPPTQEVSTGHV